MGKGRGEERTKREGKEREIEGRQVEGRRGHPNSHCGYATFTEADILMCSPGGNTILGHDLHVFFFSFQHNMNSD